MDDDEEREEEIEEDEDEEVNLNFMFKSLDPFRGKHESLFPDCATIPNQGHFSA